MSKVFTPVAWSRLTVSLHFWELLDLVTFFILFLFTSQNVQVPTFLSGTRVRVTFQPYRDAFCPSIQTCLLKTIVLPSLKPGSFSFPTFWYFLPLAAPQTAPHHHPSSCSLTWNNVLLFFRLFLGLNRSWGEPAAGRKPACPVVPYLLWWSRSIFILFYFFIFGHVVSDAQKFSGAASGLMIREKWRKRKTFSPSVSFCLTRGEKRTLCSLCNPRADWWKTAVAQLSG